jgi:hypothetical protein
MDIRVKVLHVWEAHASSHLGPGIPGSIHGVGIILNLIICLHVDGHIIHHINSLFDIVVIGHLQIGLLIRGSFCKATLAFRFNLFGWWPLEPRLILNRVDLFNVLVPGLDLVSDWHLLDSDAVPRRKLIVICMTCEFQWIDFGLECVTQCVPSVVKRII